MCNTKTEKKTKLEGKYNLGDPNYAKHVSTYFITDTTKIQCVSYTLLTMTYLEQLAVRPTRNKLHKNKMMNELMKVITFILKDLLNEVLNTLDMQEPKMESDQKWKRGVENYVSYSFDLGALWGGGDVHRRELRAGNVFGHVKNPGIRCAERI